MKNYLIIGNLNAVTYKEVFPLFKDRKMWMGWNHIKWFEQPDGSKTDKMGDLSRWFTNLSEVDILDKYCPEQFEILAQMANTKVDENNFGYPFINRERKYARVLIKKR